MAKKFDVVCVVGEYNGKKKYKNVGMVNENTEGHLSLKLDHPVTVDDEGKVVSWFMFFEPKPRDNQDNGGNDDSGEIPF